MNTKRGKICMAQETSEWLKQSEYDLMTAKDKYKHAKAESQLSQRSAD